jgi:hypothetical protein
MFDPQNPDRRSWSQESPRDKDGVRLAGICWEYRILVRNTSNTRTMRNVCATIEGMGMLPRRPEFVVFDATQMTTSDIQPGAERLIVILRWPCPAIQAGMAAGESAYGPVKVVITADDVPPVERVFRVNPERLPMLYD